MYFLLFTIWGIVVLVQLGFWGVFFQRFVNRYTETKNASVQIAISVVVCARNELQNLQENLPKWLDQQKVDYELIVVDDASTDGSLEYLKEQANKYSKLRLVSIEKKEKAGKKYALYRGIQTAKNDWVLLTDADCRPVSSFWIKGMQQKIAPTTELVLGYGPYEYFGGWLNRWIRFETIYVALQYMSMAWWGMPYMGVGRNLLYKKECFLKHASTLLNSELASGDDDLLVNKMANASNTTICLDTDTFMFSSPPTSWKKLFFQKTRHYSTATSYQWLHQLILGALSISHILFWLILLVLLFGKWQQYVVCITIIRMILVYSVWNVFSEKVRDKEILKYVCFFDFFAPIYYLILMPSLFFKNKMRW